MTLQTKNLPLLFQGCQQTVNTDFLKAEMKKILSFSENEASELQNSNIESFDDLAFFRNKVVVKRHPKSLLQI